MIRFGMRAAKYAAMAAGAALLAGCGLPTAGPYYEDLRYAEELADKKDPGFDLIQVTPQVVQASNIDESLGFELELIDARPERTAILGVGDVVQVTVWERGENGLFSPIGGATSLISEIEESGNIYLPYLGNVRASGRTADGLRKHIRDIPDFPQEGILFRDVTPLLLEPKVFAQAVEALAEPFLDAGIERVLGIESRGFIFGVPLAIHMGLGFTPVRKPGKLPYKTHSEEYTLEYGTDTLEIHQDGVHKDERILVVDDLLATGGTMAATCRLVESAGGHVVGCATIIELAFLEGRKKLEGRRVEALITVD